VRSAAASYRDHGTRRALFWRLPSPVESEERRLLGEGVNIRFLYSKNRGERLFQVADPNRVIIPKHRMDQSPAKWT